MLLVYRITYTSTIKSWFSISSDVDFGARVDGNSSFSPVSFRSNNFWLQLRVTRVVLALPHRRDIIVPETLMVKMYVILTRQFWTSFFAYYWKYPRHFLHCIRASIFLSNLETLFTERHCGLLTFLCISSAIYSMTIPRQKKRRKRKTVGKKNLNTVLSNFWEQLIFCHDTLRLYIQQLLLLYTFSTEDISNVTCSYPTKHLYSAGNVDGTSRTNITRWKGNNLSLSL